MKIKEVFEKCSEEGRSALTIFVSCGDHGLEFTEKLVESLAKSGADMVELGVPFSDPTADGKTIQEAGQRALGCGTTLEGIFEMVKKLRRKGVQIPFILFSYMNPLFKMGLSKAAKKSSESGVNGWLVVDAPFEESEEIVSACAPEGLDVIELVSPLTPPERVEKIVNSIQRRLESSGEAEIPSAVIGQYVMDALSTLDHIAYIRFASVYKDFREVKDFEDFVDTIDRFAKPKQSEDEE